MTIPDFQTVMLPVLRAAADGEVRITDIVERLADEFGLSQEERAHLLPSGRQTTFANRVHWAKSYLGKAGLVELTRRAHFRITDRGREVLAAPPERIDIKFLNHFPDFQRFRQAEAEAATEAGTAQAPSASQGDTVLTPDEVMRGAHRQLEAALADDLLQRIRAGTPAFFESVVVRLLVAMGYGGSMAEIDKALVGGTGDGGVDGVIDQDPLGLDRIYVQAKRYADGNSVGAGAIRDFFGSLDRFKANKGLFVTTSTFSPSARETAELLSKRIVLIDGTQFTRLMIRHGVGCRVEDVLHIKKLDEEFFEA
ncbi:restriction system protein [Azospirillum lipoferum]|uniref:Restriction endonuclease n=1 Tax=Azospirillum lipoferum TaxID=193 RepID=A0A5A9GL16_AZOLI|nr:MULTISPECIES: restriction endonuclease [Azospirillum]KAA0593969.1 restriction endonuclease [Azospirillum lipoferum]MCP1612444.1 restriction system protein [Azospirillum lipoferum]MDW5531772.1 restriction endonuclease [Azospirillum sp. NL1]